MDSSTGKIVVAVKAGKEVSRNPLAWALTHVIRPGDSITLLVILSAGNNQGRKFWTLPRFAADCGSSHGRTDRPPNSPDRKFEISESLSQMMLQFHGVYDQNKMNVRIKIVPAFPTGVVAEEARETRASWVVLDRHLKVETKKCAEQLQCNIVAMNRSQAKVLKLHLQGGGVSNNNEKLKVPISEPPDPSPMLDNDEMQEPIWSGRMKLTSSSPMSFSSPELIMATSSFNTRTNHEAVWTSSSNDLTSSPSSVNISPFTESVANANKTKGESISGLGRCGLNDKDNQITAPLFGSFNRGELASSCRWLNNAAQLGGGCSSSGVSRIRSPSSSNLSPASDRSYSWLTANEYCEDEHYQTETAMKEKFNKLSTNAGTINDQNGGGSFRESVSRLESSQLWGMSKNSSSSRLSPPLCSQCQHKAPPFGKPPRLFSYAELEAATNGFSDMNFLAEGGFGSVHRGILDDGLVVAVKQHRLASSQGDVEFCSEVEVLSCAQHRNVVMLIGFCIEGKKRLLVYEYVCNGSLDSHLYGNRRAPLGWEARWKIAAGAARGLRYLHEDCRIGCIVHRDMRPNNVLLTHDYEPLVGDFGLARWQPDGCMGVETRVIGTFGYLAPEYAQSGEITEKADVYALGVVLVELITGRRAVDITRPRGQHCLTEWARPLLECQAIHELLDPRLTDVDLQFHSHQLYCMIQAASSCLCRDPSSRPKMSQVLRILEGNLVKEPIRHSISIKDHCRRIAEADR